MNDPQNQKWADNGVGSGASFGIGQRVRFAGYRTASFDYPSTPTCDGTITSVKRPGQFGFDYWVRWDSGYSAAYTHGELTALPNV